MITKVKWTCIKDMIPIYEESRILLSGDSLTIDTNLEISLSEHHWLTVKCDKIKFEVINE